MSRKVRIIVFNATHSVLVRGLDELSLFKDEIDKAMYIKLIEKYAIIYHINVYGYTFNENSVEIMLNDSKGKLSKFMKCVNGTYCQHYYNVKYNRRGTIYKDRFKSRLVANYIHYNFMRNIMNDKLPVNDYNLVNFDLDSSIVIDMIEKYFNFDSSKFIWDKHMIYSENELNAISMLVFSLRSFCGYIHKKIAKLLKGVSESTSSTLSLNGVNFIMDNKFKEFYYRLLMIIYSDSKNCINM